MEGDSVLVDNIQGKVVKVSGRRVRVELSNGKVVWREMNDVKVLKANGTSAPMPVPQAPETPRAMQNVAVLTGIKHTELTKDILNTKRASVLKPVITVDKSKPVFGNDVKLKSNPMVNVLKDLGTSDVTKALKHTHMTDKSAPVIDSNASVKADPHQFVRNELLQGVVFSKILFKDNDKPAEGAATTPAKPAPAPTTGKIVYQSPSIDMFDLKATLGIGNFGRVRLVKHKELGHYHAIKIISKANILALKELPHVKNEKSILQSIDHPFVVNLLGSFQDSHNVYLIMEYVSGGELYHHHRHQKQFNATASRFYTAQILLAIEYLHSNGIVYRDLKPENVLVGADGYVKVADFGSAKRVADKTHTMCGTPEYQAPEIIQHKGHTKAVDYWSLGVMLFEFFVGKTPFVDDTPFAVYKRIFNYAITEELDYPSCIPDDAKNLIQKLLEPDADLRLGMGQGGVGDIKKHKFFDGLDWQALQAKQMEAPFTFPPKDEADTSNFSKYVEVELHSGPVVDRNGQMFKDF